MQAGEWRREHWKTIDPPNAVVETISAPHRLVNIHLDQVRAQKVEANTPPEPVHPSVAVDAVSVPEFDTAAFQTAFITGSLQQAANHAYTTSSLGHSKLVLEFVPDFCRGNPSKKTTVLRVKATEEIPLGGTSLVPAMGNISLLESMPREKRSYLNLDQIGRVEANVIGTTKLRGQTATTTTRYAMVSPLDAFNRGKRKAGDEDGDAVLATVPLFWGVLYAPRRHARQYEVSYSLNGRQWV